MPMLKLALKPGVDLEASPTAAQFRIVACNLIRFYAGWVQKLGGWQKYALTQFIGTCRGLHGWADIVGRSYLAIGTEQRLELIDGGMLVDITPVTTTTNPAPAFSTVVGTPVVTISDGAQAPLAGDWINIQTPVSIGGLVLFGLYRVVTGGIPYTISAPNNAASTAGPGGTVPSYTTLNGSSIVTVTLGSHGLTTGDIYNAVISTTVAAVTILGFYSATVTGLNTFTITVTGTANASTTVSENGGNARIQYLLATGFAVNTGLTGFGGGQYGGGDYGGSSGGASVGLLRQWSLDHFGQDLIASPSNFGIYYWQPPALAPAVVVPNSPLYNISVFVMPQAEIIASLGAEIGGTLQPLLIRWCDAGDFTDWTATATNQAGSYFLPTGSGLVGGLATGLGATLWTDQDVWAMTYIGFPLVFGFNRLANNCGLVAQRAVGILGGLVMWLGLEQFYQYGVGSSVNPVQCSVWDFYFNNVDFTQVQQIHCAVNSVFNEFAWHFPVSPNSPLYNPLYPMAYVKVAVMGGMVWDYGFSSQYQRTAWCPHSPAGNPMGADLNGYVQQHDSPGVRDADGSSMQSFWQSGYIDTEEGSPFVYSDMLIPDFVTIGNPSFTPTITSVEYPNDTPTNVIPFPAQFSNTSKFITYGARGRQLSFGFAESASNLNTFSRLGAVRIRWSKDGSF